METSVIGRRLNRGSMEENILAILDATNSKDTQDANDDRIAFLEAVRAACISPDNGTPPTNKMCEAVFQILRVGKSLELMMESYRLLNELDKCFPQLYISNKGVSKSSELVVAEEAWSPFLFNLDIASSERKAADKSAGGPLDSSGFCLLIQDLAEMANGTNHQTLGAKALGSMLLFQYLVNVLEGDFLLRNRVYEETMNWTLLRESLLNMLLSSRRINYKSLMKDYLSIMCGLANGISDDLESTDDSAAKPSHSGNTTAAFALLEVGNSASAAMQKLLVMIMEFDKSKKKADMQGSTTRADGVRTPLVEIILDELTYDTEMLASFFQIFNEPKWKLEIILQYFSKYTAKAYTRTRRSNGSTEDVTFSGVLKCFSNMTSTRNITKKISSDVVQVLLAHAFQAHLSLTSSQQDCEEKFDSKDEDRGNSLLKICQHIISAFSSLRRTDEKLEILPFGKEALFTAATILATKSKSLMVNS